MIFDDKFFLKTMRGEKGITTPEFLIISAGIGIIALIVVNSVLPALQASHNTVLNRVTNLTGSGY
ncbi:MAG: hypothetical protein K6T80_07535 [Firmicutes bacterium]|nr:hypothetical protein [Bacillota bacterium]